MRRLDMTMTDGGRNLNLAALTSARPHNRYVQGQCACDSQRPSWYRCYARQARLN